MNNKGDNLCFNTQERTILPLPSYPRFQDIPHAYCGAFQPGTNIFTAKSTEGFLAVYDLNQMSLLKKTFQWKLISCYSNRPHVSLKQVYDSMN